MKKVFVTIFAAAVLAFSVSAQDFTPGWNLGVMGGINYVTSNSWTIGKFEHVTPNVSLNMGYDVAPWLNLRGSLSGISGTYPTNKGKVAEKIKYAQLGVDGVVDICDIFSYNPERFFSPYVFLGVAGNYRFKVGNEDAAFCPGVRAGLGFDFRISDGVKIALELQDNGLNNKFNTLDDNTYFGGDILKWKRPFKWDDNFVALIGVKFAL